MDSSPTGWWGVPPDRLTLGAGEVHIWRLSLHAASYHAQTLNVLLGPDETSRARSFHFLRDCDRYITVRATLRVLLGSYLGIAPQEIRFQYSARGKPALAPALNRAHPALNFNVSHSHELALLAFAHNPAVGIDLEYIRPETAGEQIAERHFSAQETASLRALPLHMQPRAFFHCWTRKEAFVKATGDGLSRPLDQFSVSLVPGEPARLLDIRGETQEPANWLLQDLDTGPGYAAALAVQKPVNQVYCWEYALD
jgi:4'-phosphopantetheinyl transferase